MQREKSLKTTGFSFDFVFSQVLVFQAQMLHEFYFSIQLKLWNTANSIHINTASKKLQGSIPVVSIFLTTKMRTRHPLRFPRTTVSIQALARGKQCPVRCTRAFVCFCYTLFFFFFSNENIFFYFYNVTGYTSRAASYWYMVFAGQLLFPPFLLLASDTPFALAALYNLYIYCSN